MECIEKPSAHSILPLASTQPIRESNSSEGLQPSQTLHVELEQKFSHAVSKASNTAEHSETDLFPTSSESPQTLQTFNMCQCVPALRQSAFSNGEILGNVKHDLKH